jgi:hypothetical protein
MLTVARSANPRATMRSGVVEHVHRADGRIAQAQRQRERRLETSLEGRGREQRPAAGRGLQVLLLDPLPGTEGVQARAFLSLELEQLQQAHGLAGGGHQPEAAGRGSQHHPGGRHPQQADAPVSQPGQQIDDVVVIDQGVGHLD